VMLRHRYRDGSGVDGRALVDGGSTRIPRFMSDGC
jgi:hypothetical protein